jgi:hypothetical protein
MTPPEHHPVPRPAGLLARLRAHKAAEAELRAYVAGLLDALGIPPERLVGIDDVTGELLLADPPDAADHS